VVGDLLGPLPDGPFDRVVSALAIHHLRGTAKRDLFFRLRPLLGPTGRFVMADVVVPQDPDDAVTPLSEGFDHPSSLPELLEWLEDAAFGVSVVWSWKVSSSITISAFAVLILCVAVVVLGVLQLFLTRTRTGRELRATADDPDTAELVGIDARSAYARATAIAVATAALAGIFLGLRSAFGPSDGASMLIFAFEAVVIGGLGSLWGTLFGGIVLGVAQNIGEQIDPQYFALFGHLVFLVVLVTRAVAESGTIGATRRMPT